VIIFIHQNNETSSKQEKRKRKKKKRKENLTNREALGQCIPPPSNILLYIHISGINVFASSLVTNMLI